MEHQPVLMQAVLEALAIRPDGLYVDATYGRGGHSRAILQRLGPEGRLLAFDRDPQACGQAWRELGREPRFRIRPGSFTQLGAALAEEGLGGRVHGILFDLGVSSPQLDEAARGFSFLREGPLDMRMDPQTGASVAAWLARAEREEISRVLREYGEERHHWRIAGAIVRARDTAPITTTTQLADIVARAMPGPRQPQRKKMHPATRTFQALRIFINRELEELDAVLPQALEALAPGGRLAVISFHSLEDRRVKRFLRDCARPPQDPRDLGPAPAPRLRLIGKAVMASEAEIAANPRARSAVLRVAEKLGSA
ncbi:MAG TPA: 16S rRNA (cytosine(1402)-N(4))-methyltransferase RsmH [Nevskiales bacterium]|nr:16S rRNA (cytosine(1402)-N(4))-methyltransferase RsmH [Nevskiales bacterium]